MKTTKNKPSRTLHGEILFGIAVLSWIALFGYCLNLLAMAFFMGIESITGIGTDSKWFSALFFIWYFFCGVVIIYNYIEFKEMMEGSEDVHC